MCSCSATRHRIFTLAVQPVARSGADSETSEFNAMGAPATDKVALCFGEF